jgi:hypothetical protein
MERPKRRFAVEIHVSGDEWADVQHALRDLLSHIEEHGPQCSAVSGGVTSGHWVRVTEDPEQTSQRYHEQLAAYLGSRPPPR